jgi:hypothetical protein
MRYDNEICHTSNDITKKVTDDYFKIFLTVFLLLNNRVFDKM